MPKVEFKSDNITKEDVAAGTNLKALCEEVGSSLMFACGQGVCGTCLITVESGMENLSPKDETETQTLTSMGANEKQRLACKCVINGDVSFTNG